MYIEYLSSEYRPCGMAAAAMMGDSNHGDKYGHLYAHDDILEA